MDTTRSREGGGETGIRWGRRRPIQWGQARANGPKRPPLIAGARVALQGTVQHARRYGPGGEWRYHAVSAPERRDHDGQPPRPGSWHRNRPARTPDLRPLPAAARPAVGAAACRRPGPPTP